MDKPKSYQEAWDAFEVNQLELKELHDNLETARKTGEAIDDLLQEKNICPVVDDRENIKNLIYAETQPLREQLEIARKALDRIRLHNDSYVSHRIATEALAQIGAGRFDRKCPHCDFVTEYPLMFENHVKYGHDAGQKGGKS